MNTEYEVRRRILRRLRLGLLPCAPAASLAGGIGEEGRCHGCGRRISRGDLEIDVECSGDSAGAAYKLIMHPKCLYLWYDECNA